MSPLDCAICVTRRSAGRQSVDSRRRTSVRSRLNRSARSTKAARCHRSGLAHTVAVLSKAGLLGSRPKRQRHFEQYPKYATSALRRRFDTATNLTDLGTGRQGTGEPPARTRILVPKTRPSLARATNEQREEWNTARHKQAKRALIEGVLCTRGEMRPGEDEREREQQPGARRGAHARAAAWFIMIFCWDSF